MTEAFDHAICAVCGGECCKSCSCLAHPEDFGTTPEEVMTNLRHAMESGMWLIDYWDGDCPSLPEGAAGFFVRPRMVEGMDVYRMERGLTVPIPWVHGSWGGPCLFLTETGCALPDEARPLGGRSVVPATDGEDCKQPLNWEGTNEKPTFALAWYPYEDAIHAMVDDWRNRDERA